MAFSGHAIGITFLNDLDEQRYIPPSSLTERPYKTRHIFGFSDGWLLIAA